MTMHKIKVDVMIDGGTRFYRTIIYHHCPLFKLRVKDIEDYVFSKLPTLRYRNDVQLVVYN